MFTGAARNPWWSPLALALPDALWVAAVVAFTQPLVEALGMPGYVRLVPRRGPAEQRAKDVPVAS